MSEDPSKTEARSTDTRFKPGNPGGPGRTVGSRNRASVLLDQLADDEAEALFKSTLDAAKEGKPWAVELILSRIWPARKSRPVSIALPPMQNATDTLAAQAAVIDAATTGQVTLDEAQALSALVEGHRRAIETVTLEERLRKLEEAIAKR
jgi:hypothetical protein